jgi:hypothetical protein
MESTRGKFCTDLHALSPDIHPNLFVSRTKNEINIIDLSAGLVFAMVNNQSNPIQKFQKMAMIDFGEWVNVEKTKK